MKTISIHSVNGGTGKTTIAVLLAKYAAMEGERVCLIDCDFFGAGLAYSLRYKKMPSLSLDDLLTRHAVDLADYPLSDLLGEYQDDQASFSVIFSRSPIEPEEPLVLEHILAYESQGGWVRSRLTSLRDHYLTEKGYTLTIIDCHSGLAHLSKSIAQISDLPVVTVSPRTGELKSVLSQIGKDTRFYGLDRSAKMCLLGFRWARADFQVAVTGLDPSWGGSVATLPESMLLRGMFDVGSSGQLPSGTCHPELAFCKELLEMSL